MITNLKAVRMNEIWWDSPADLYCDFKYNEQEGTYDIVGEQSGTYYAINCADASEAIDAMDEATNIMVNKLEEDEKRPRLEDDPLYPA
jgi:hypothetical protein